jgi:hypothetical protein
MKLGEHPVDDLSWWFGDKMSAEEPREKSPYTPPVLTIYGTLEELTSESGNLSNDGFLGSKATI